MLGAKTSKRKNQCNVQQNHFRPEQSLHIADQCVCVCVCVCVCCHIIVNTYENCFGRTVLYVL